MNPTNRPSCRRPNCLNGQKGHEAKEGSQQKLVRHLYAADFLVRTSEVVNHGTQQGSTPFPRTVLKGLKTSDLAGRLYDAFVGYETARCSQRDPPVLHHEFDTTDGQRAPV